MDEATNKLATLMLIGQLAQKGLGIGTKPKQTGIKQAKYKASIPVGHRYKQVEGLYEFPRPVSLEVAKDTVRIAVRDKYNVTLCFDKVEIESFEVLREIE